MKRGDEVRILQPKAKRYKNNLIGRTGIITGENQGKTPMFQVLLIPDGNFYFYPFELERVYR